MRKLAGYIFRGIDISFRAIAWVAMEISVWAFVIYCKCNED